MHPESCTATTCDNGTRAAHARGTPRAPSARPRASAEAPRRNLPPRLTRNCAHPPPGTPHVEPACMSASHHHRKASSGDNDTSEVKGSAGRGGTSQSTPCTVDEHSTASPPRGSIVVTSRLDSNTTTNGEGAQRTARLYQRQRQYTPASGNPPPTQKPYSSSTKSAHQMSTSPAA